MTVRLCRGLVEVTHSVPRISQRKLDPFDYRSRFRSSSAATACPRKEGASGIGLVNFGIRIGDGPANCQQSRSDQAAAAGLLRGS